MSSFCVCKMQASLRHRCEQTSSYHFSSESILQKRILWQIIYLPDRNRKQMATVMGFQASASKWVPWQRSHTLVKRSRSDTVGQRQTVHIIHWKKQMQIVLVCSGCEYVCFTGLFPFCSVYLQQQGKERETDRLLHASPVNCPIRLHHLSPPSANRWGR